MIQRHSRLRLVRMIVFGALVVVAALAAMGCGDKEEIRDGGGGKEKPAATKVAGKGGGDSQGAPSFFNSSDSPLGRLFGSTSAGDGAKPQTSARPTRDDERFAKQLCVAGNKLFDRMDKLSREMEEAQKKSDSSDDIEDFGAALELMFKGIMDPLADFLDDFAKADPPKDLADWHKDAAKSMKEMAKALRSGDLDALDKFDDSAFPEPPADASARIEAAFGQVKECQELEKRSSDDSMGGLFGED